VGLVTFRPAGLRLRVEPILRFHRYRSLEQVPLPIREIAQETVWLAEKLADPSVVALRRRVVAVSAEAVTLEAGPTFHGRCLGAHLRAAREVIAFLVTLGPAIDERVAEMANGDQLLEALFLDAAGWLAIETTLRAFRTETLAAVRGQGVRLGPRLGPGYLDWRLTEQAAFFSLFEGFPIPVALSEDYVMIPKKSISGLFGLIPRDEEA
jgi:hypothetical protein